MRIGSRVAQNCHSKNSKGQDDRSRDPSYKDTSTENDHVPQKRKLTHAGAFSPKRTTNRPPAKTRRSSNRKRTQNPKYADDIYSVEITDSDQSEPIDSPETRSRSRPSAVVEEPSITIARHPQAGSSQQISLSGETIDLPSLRAGRVVAEELDTTTLAEGSAHQKPPSHTGIVSPVAPTAIMVSPLSETTGLPALTPLVSDVSEPVLVGIDSQQTAALLSEAQPKSPPAETGREQKSQTAKQDQPKLRKPRPEFEVKYYIVKSSPSRVNLTKWKDGKFAGRSLQSVIDGISKIVGRGQIESLKCTLYAPEISMDVTIEKDNETEFESMKLEYRKMMWSSYQNLGPKEYFEIRIEPTYSDEKRDESSSDSEMNEEDEW